MLIVLGMAKLLLHSFKYWALRYTICIFVSHKSTSSIHKETCDRCFTSFTPAFSEYLPTKAAAQHGEGTERVSIGSNGLFVKFRWTTPKSLAQKV
jgi:hypothetical protein